MIIIEIEGDEAIPPGFPRPKITMTREKFTPYYYFLFSDCLFETVVSFFIFFYSFLYFSFFSKKNPSNPSRQHNNNNNSNKEAQP